MESGVSRSDSSLCCTIKHKYLNNRQHFNFCFFYNDTSISIFTYFYTQLHKKEMIQSIFLQAMLLFLQRNIYRPWRTMPLATRKSPYFGNWKILIKMFPQKCNLFYSSTPEGGELFDTGTVGQDNGSEQFSFLHQQKYQWMYCLFMWKSLEINTVWTELWQCVVDIVPWFGSTQNKTHNKHRYSTVFSYVMLKSDAENVQYSVFQC